MEWQSYPSGRWHNGYLARHGKANLATYPQQSGQKSELGFPICRIVAVTCQSTGAVLNAAMRNFKGKGGREQTLLRTLLDTFESGDMMLGDAFLLAELQFRQVDALFEQYGSRKRSTDFSQGDKLGYRDHLITLTKPKVRPDWMTAEHLTADRCSSTMGRSHFMLQPMPDGIRTR